MKTFFKIISSSLLVLLFLGTKGQELHNPFVELTPESNSMNYKLPGKRYYIRISLTGSKFLTDEWCKGSVLLGNGERYENLILKLNTYLDELIEYNKRAGSTIMLDKSAISEFSLNFEDGHTEQFRKIFYDKFPKGDRYFSVLYEGKLGVLLWYKTEEQNASMYSDIHGIMHDSKYVLTKKYYLVFPDHTMKKFVFKRRSFLNLFPEQKKQVRRIIRKNHISFDNEKEIPRAVSLIETAIL